jgi:hypothetical protein
MQFFSRCEARSATTAQRDSAARQRSEKRSATAQRDSAATMHHSKLVAHLNHRWRTGGPSADVAEEVARHVEKPKLRRTRAIERRGERSGAGGADTAIAKL